MTSPALVATRKHVTRAVVAAVALTVALVWLFVFRPQSLGGPVQYVIVSGHSMDHALHDGDLVVARRQSSYEIGDIVAYRVPKGELGEGTMIIHRLVGGSEAEGYLVRGDNNPGQDPWKPRSADIAGKLFVHAPGVGVLLSFMRTTLGLALLAGLAGAAWTFSGPSRPKDVERRRRRAVSLGAAVLQRVGRGPAAGAPAANGVAPPWGGDGYRASESWSGTEPPRRR